MFWYYKNDFSCFCIKLKLIVFEVVLLGWGFFGILVEDL